MNVADMLTKPLLSARYHQLGSDIGLCEIDDMNCGEINVLETYRAPRCAACTHRLHFYVEMEIQVTDAGLARWQCELCDDTIPWVEWVQYPAWMWTTSPTSSAGSSRTGSTHSGDAAPSLHDLEGDDEH
jgi:hypothetical protein